MKHALLLTTFVAASLMCVAQKPAQNTANPGTVLVPMSISASDIIPASDVKAAEGVQALEWKRLFSTEIRSQFHYWPFGVSSNDMFKYDAKTQSINIARNRALIIPTPGALPTGVEIGIVRSVDNGASWNFDVIQKTSEQFFGVPVFGWVNPNEATDPSALPVLIFGIRYPTPALTYGGMATWVRTANGTFDIPIDGQNPPAPGYTVQFGDLYSDATATSVHWAGMLNPDATRQYGAYGYFNFNLSDEDFGQSPTIPSTWALSNWRPSDLLDRSFNAPVLLEGDASGSLYACFNNFSFDQLEVRGIEVSKSTDQGKTWSATFNSMPLALLDQFAQQHGGDIAIQPLFTAYDGGDLLVTGNNEYSFFFGLATGIRSATDPSQVDSLVAYHIVEAKFISETWSLNAVAELQTVEFQQASIVDSIATAIGAPAISVGRAGRGHEIQAAITEDGKTIVVKYVDINTTRLNEFQAIRVFVAQSNGSYVEGDPITRMMDTDLFIVTRATTSNTWSAPVNKTDDEDMAFRTYMPDVVPSATNIPIVRLLGLRTGTVSSLLPKSVAQVVWNGAVNIEYTNGGTVSVADEKTYTFRFNTIAPNPALSTAEVTFTLDHPATVSVELYDMLGSKIQTVMTQNLVPGLQGVNVDVSALSAGTYNVSLVVDGIRSMKPFVVVR